MSDTTQEIEAAQSGHEPDLPQGDLAYRMSHAAPNLLPGEVRAHPDPWQYVVVAVVLGVVCTAVAYTLWMEGTHRIRMQHSAVLGFLTPVAAPFFAFALAGQSITAWTAAGGALILGAGFLVALRGRADAEGSLAPA